MSCLEVEHWGCVCAHERVCVHAHLHTEVCSLVETAIADDSREEELGGKTKYKDVQIEIIRL